MRSNLRLPTTVLAGMLMLGSAWADPGVAFLDSEQTKSLGLPFSEAVRVGDMLYLSGQLGTLPGTLDLGPGGVEAETRQIMANIERILEANGSRLDRVVKCTVMMADMAEWPRLNAVYVTYFPGPKPARSAFGAAGLALDARVEIECWATVAED
jgi:2-iminobutanoate/2-iminopropanoate deaminase